MDNDEMTYLSYLADKPQSLLLQTNDENMGAHYSGLNVEPMFTDIDGTSSWAAIDGLPILMNNSFITEDQVISPVLETDESSYQEMYATPTTAAKEEESLEPSEQPEILAFPIEAPKGIVATNGLFLSNDVLLQFNLKVDEEQKESLQEENSVLAVYEEKDTPIPESPLKQDTEEAVINLPDINDGEEVIQLLNQDGTVVTISKKLLTPALVNETKEVNTNTTQDISQLVDGMYEEVTALKCRKCNFLTESHIDVIKHILNNHLQPQIEKKQADVPKKIITKLVKGEVPMKSLLNVNNKKPQDDVQTIYLCSVCSTTCANTDELRDHMVNVHKLSVSVEALENGNGASVQNAQPKESASKILHKNIVQSQQKAKKIKCSVKGCVARFAQDAVRLRHEKCHVDGQKKQFKCTVCNKLFSIWRVCSLHIWKCHKIDVGLFSCPMCNNYKTLSPHNLMNHMATHASDHPFVCSYCGKTFKQMSQLRNHHNTHIEHKEDLPTWASQQKCDQCGNYFSCSKTLKKHIQQVHNKFKPFICNICGHNTTRKAMLQLHLRQHTGEKPHKCTVCQYSTGDHNSLRRHMMRHNGSAKYKCPHCDYKCIQSSSFKFHMTKKHPGMGGTYTCLLCSFTFINEVAYKIHVQEHEKEKQQAAEAEKIEKPTRTNEEEIVSNDEETQNYFLSTTTTDHVEDTIDTGGITIPAGCEINV